MIDFLHKMCDNGIEVTPMFTKLTLHNFRCFEKIELDLSAKKNAPKHLALIYGENGAGKSNLVSAFVMLCELLQTLDVRDMLEDLITQKSIFNDEKYEQMVRQKYISELRDMKAIINDVRMVGSENNTVVRYDFAISGRVGSYTVEFGETEIVHERLEFIINKRRGVYFDCTKNSILLNEKIFISSDLKTEIEFSARKFWGKHSILAIMLYELKDKSTAFGWGNISPNLRDVLNEFDNLSCAVKIGHRMWYGIHPPIALLADAERGIISTAEETQLDLVEGMLTSLFTSTNSDIQRVYYERRADADKIRYQMFFEKKIAAKLRQIHFSKESTGTHNLLDMFCYLLTACVGGIVVIDEADSGIHDALFWKVLQETYPHISGQLIMTTHNTMLMETDFGRESVYIIHENNHGEAEINCVNDHERRTFANNNIRNKYLNNAYGGYPNVRPIHIEEQVNAIQAHIDHQAR